MQNDPMPYIVFAALLGGSIGFFSCAILVSRRIRQAEFEGWLRGRNCLDREKDFHLEHGTVDFRDKGRMEKTFRRIRTSADH